MGKEDCGLYIKMIHDTLDRRANNELRRVNLTLSQVQLLLTLYDAEEETCSLKELETKLHVAQSTIVGITLRLEKKGFLTGLAVADDKRMKKVRLTDAGRACCLEAQKQTEKTEAFVLSNLSREEKKQFHALLKKVYETLT